MKRFNNAKSSRRGAIAVLAAVLLVPMLILMAFSINVGYIVSVQAELQNAADAAALAGASQLMTPQMSGNVNQNSLATTAIASTSSECQKFSVLNAAGGVNLSLPGADIRVGYLSNPQDLSQTLSAWTNGAPHPNTVQATLRRDGTSNLALPLFFSGLTGMPTWNGTATATASFSQASTVTGFKSSGPNGKLLPIAIDINYWNTFTSTGKSPNGSITDLYKVEIPGATQPPYNVKNGGDNIPELGDVYPNKTSPGNFGLVDIGPPANDTNSFRDWINNGPTKSDLNYFGTNGLQATPGAPATLKGGPGLKSTLVSDLAAVVGEPRVVPLFSSYSGNGSNTQYTIVGFAGITIVQAQGSGSNIQISFQPTIVVDSTATTGSGSGTQFVYATTPLSLTR